MPGRFVSETSMEGFSGLKTILDLWPRRSELAYDVGDCGTVVRKSSVFVFEMAAELKKFESCVVCEVSGYQKSVR